MSMIQSSGCKSRAFLTSRSGQDLVELGLQPIEENVQGGFGHLLQGVILLA